jgi:RAT1-interacting protein
MNEKIVTRIRIDTTCDALKHKPRPTFAQPTEIASFSLNNSTGERLPPTLRKYVPPTIPTDLNTGYENFGDEDPSITSDLKPVLDTIAEKQIETKGSIVTFRNNLNKIFSTPYDAKTWEVDVKREDGVIYLGIKHLEGPPANEMHRKTMYWGRRFEDICTEGAKDTQFCSVIKTKLNNHKIILGAEIDCYAEVKATTASKQPAQPSGSLKRRREDGEGEEEIKKQSTDIVYTELKTARMLTNRHVENNFRKWKLLHFWLQSFLAGVPNILCGFRDDDGMLIQTKLYNTLEIPRIASGQWDPWICLQFADFVFARLWECTKDGKKYTLKCAPPHQEVDLVEINE